MASSGAPHAVTTSTLRHAQIAPWVLVKSPTGAKCRSGPRSTLNDGDAKVEVETSGGLVTEVSGNAAGTNTYVHSGDDLTAHVGPEGETKYEYEAGRMTKVTLPNGTWGSIAYWPDGRVRSVTVKHADWSAPRTTEFEYRDEPSRRTTVFPPEAPHITYDIGDDGSVFKSWNTAEPPTISRRSLAGGCLQYFEWQVQEHGRECGVLFRRRDPESAALREDCGKRETFPSRKSAGTSE